MHTIVVAGELGSIFYLKKQKRWRCVLQVHDEYGRSFEKQFSSKDKKKLGRRAASWLETYKSGLPSQRMSVEHCCELYIERCEKKKRAKSTISGYKNYLKNYVRPTIGHLELSQLRAAHVERMMDEIPGEGQAKANCRAFLRAAIKNVAMKAGVLATNPAALADAPTIKRQKRERMTLEKWIRVVQAEDRPIQRALWFFLGGTGRRPGPVRRLTWEELFKEDDGWWCQLLSDKTEEGKKPFPVPRQIMDELLKLPRTCKYVFPTSAGTPFEEGNLRGFWVEALAKANVPYTNMYQLRKMFASDKARKVKEEVLKRLMGHTDIRTTRQSYVEAFDEDLRAAVDGDIWSR
jgi:integrase